MAVGGEIRRYGLEDWWLSAFSAEERLQIALAYQPLGIAIETSDEGESTPLPLVDGEVPRQPELDEGPFLATLATWVLKPSFHDLALRIALKASSAPMPSDPWQAHFMFANLCKVFYRFRDRHPDALEQAVWACEQDISLSANLDPANHGNGIVVSHYCFKQLAIIEEKRGNPDRAIKLCRQALAQGWSGDWEKRMARLSSRKMAQPR